MFTPYDPERCLCLAFNPIRAVHGFFTQVTWAFHSKLEILVKLFKLIGERKRSLWDLICFSHSFLRLFSTPFPRRLPQNN